MRKLVLLAAVAASLVWSADRAQAQCSGGRCGGFAPAYVGGGYCPTCVGAYGAYGTVAPVQVAAVEAPATLVVSLPENAKLFIDNNATTSTSATRTFTSPALKPGFVYTYVLKAQVVVDGETKDITKDVTVRPGEETRVSLDMPVATATTAAK